MSQSSSGRLATIVSRAAVVSLFLCSGIALALALAPDAVIRDAFVLIDRDDSRHALQPVHRDALRALAGLAAALLGAAALAAVRLRPRLQQTVRRASGEITDCVRSLRDAAPLPAGPTLWTVAALCAIGAVLRISWLDLPMRFDEADTYNFFASRNLFSLISDYTAPNNHIFHSICVHYATAWFGSAAPVVRLPALLAGIALLPLTYLFARRFCGEAAAVLATALVAASPPMVRYSADARGYTILTVCVLLLCLLAPYLVKQRSVALWTPFGVLVVVGGFTIPVMLYPVAALSVWMLVEARPERRLPLLRELALCGVVSGAAALALYAPAIGRTTLHSLVGNRYVAAFTWPYFFEKLERESNGFWAWLTMWMPGWIVFLLVVGLAASLKRGWTRRLLTVAVLSIGALMLAQRVVPYSRVFHFAIPVLLTLAASGWSMILERSLGARSALRASRAVGLALGAYLASQVWRGPDRAPTPTMVQEVEARSVAMRLIPQIHDEAVLSHMSLSEPIRFYMLRAGLERHQMIVHDELTQPDRLDRYSKIWFVRRRDWRWPKSAAPRPSRGELLGAGSTVRNQSARSLDAREGLRRHAVAASALRVTIGPSWSAGRSAAIGCWRSLARAAWARSIAPRTSL